MRLLMKASLGGAVTLEWSGPPSHSALCTFHVVGGCRLGADVCEREPDQKLDLVRPVDAYDAAELDYQLERLQARSRRLGDKIHCMC